MSENWQRQSNATKTASRQTYSGETQNCCEKKEKKRKKKKESDFLPEWQISHDETNFPAEEHSRVRSSIQEFFNARKVTSDGRVGKRESVKRIQKAWTSWTIWKSWLRSMWKIKMFRAFMNKQTRAFNAMKEKRKNIFPAGVKKKLFYAEKAPLLLLWGRFVARKKENFNKRIGQCCFRIWPD